MSEEILKPRSLRVSDEVFSKFEELTKDFPNKNLCLYALISAYEIEQNKALIPEMAKDIETFQSFMTSLIDLYNSALFSCDNSEKRIRAEYSRQLESNSDTIADLQERLKKATERVKEAEEKVSLLSSDLEASEKRSDKAEAQIEVLNSEAIKNNEVIKTLTETLSEYKSYAVVNKELESKINLLTKEFDGVNLELSNLKQEGEALKKSHSAEVLNLKKDFEAEIKGLKKDFEYQKKDIELTSREVMLKEIDRVKQECAENTERIKQECAEKTDKVTQAYSNKILQLVRQAPAEAITEEVPKEAPQKKERKKRESVKTPTEEAKGE